MLRPTEMITVLPVKAFTDNYIWLIVDKTSRQAICIDPGEAQPVLDFIKKNQLQLEAILITHHHYDHIDGITELCYHVPNLNVYAPYDRRIPKVTSFIKNESFLNVLTYCFEIRYTPGHTKTHLCYYETNHHWLFCGDTLFSAGCGRVFEGTHEELYNSLEDLKTLPDQTKIFCGHEYTLQNLRFAKTVEPNNATIQAYLKELEQTDRRCTLPSTMGLEKQINPFLRTQTESVKQHVAHKVIETSSALDAFKALRIEKDSF